MLGSIRRNFLVKHNALVNVGRRYVTASHGAVSREENPLFSKHVAKSKEM